jgi:hypothetical protein
VQIVQVRADDGGGGGGDARCMQVSMQTKQRAPRKLEQRQDPGSQGIGAQKLVARPPSAARASGPVGVPDQAGAC